MVTREPDGRAFVQYRFSAPQAFETIDHRYPQAVDPPYRITQAAIEWSDDDATWTEAARLANAEGSFSFSVGDAGAHRNWRLRVLESGSAAEVVIGPLTWRTHAGALARLPVDLVWLSLIPGVLLFFANSRRGLTNGRLYLAIALPIALFGFVLAVGYAPFHTIVWPDSASYLSLLTEGSFSAYRNAGYPAFLFVVAHTIGLAYLFPVQLALSFAASVVAGWLIARRNSRWLAPVLALALVAQGWIIVHAAEVLTEALFCAGFTLGAAGLAASADRASKMHLIVAGAGIAVATAAKSNGIILLVPAVLLVRYLPPGRRLSALALAFAPAAVIYLSMCQVAYYRNGSYTPENFAGIALIGHVGWMLNGEGVEPQAVTDRILAAVERTLSKRPQTLMHFDSLQAIDNYVNYTTTESDYITWIDIMKTVESERWDTATLNSYLLRLAMHSIATKPQFYILHVAAHFYGLWRDLGANFEGYQAASVGLREMMIPQNASNERYPGILPPPSGAHFWLDSGAMQQETPLFFKTPWLFSAHVRITVVVGISSILISLVFFLPVTIYRKEVMIALSINAYLLSSALFQGSLTRYAFPVMPAVILLCISILEATVNLSTRFANELVRKGQ